MTVKNRIDRLISLREENREAEVLCVMQSGEKKVIRWLDAVFLAIRNEPKVDHFEDHGAFKKCADLPNAIIGYDSGRAAERNTHD